MGEFSISHVLILTVILLVFFGPSRLPALGQSIGKAIRGFKDGLNETQNQLNKTVDQPPVTSGSNSPSTEEILNKKTEEKVNQNNS